VTQKTYAVIGLSVCILIVSIIYLLTMPSSLTWAHYGADGGDLIRAVAKGSLPHPPGFPMYLLLGNLFIRLPWGNPAWRMNLLSVVTAASGTGLAVLALAKILDQPSPLVLAISGLSLGLAPLLWSQALITEVYALCAFWSALLLLAVTVRDVSPWGGGLIVGLGLGVHPTLIFLTPLAVWGMCRAERARIGRLITLGVAILLGWGIMYGGVLLVLARTPSPWADLSSFNGWWNIASARLYRGYIFDLPMVDWPRRLLALGGILARQFTPIGALVSILGVKHLWEIKRGLALSSLVACLGCVLYAFGYNTTDSMVYLTTVLSVAMLWFGVGLKFVIERLCRWQPYLRWLLVLLPLVQGIVFWCQMDVSDNREALLWAERVLARAPDRALVITDEDAHTFALWYVHDVLEREQGIQVIDRDMLGYLPYRGMIAEELGLDELPVQRDVAELAFDLGRPLVYADEMAQQDNE